MNELLEGYLESLSAEGKVDSAGVFTVDLSQGLAKMTQFQLPSPYHYALRIVSLATLLQAQRLDISGPLHAREYALEGVGFSAAEMRDLFSSFLSERPQEWRLRALRNLALAIYAAARLPNCQVAGSTWDGQSGARWHLEAGQLSIHPLETDYWLGTRILVRLRRTWSEIGKGIAELLSGISLQQPEDLQLLRRYARYCPVPIVLQGQGFTLERQGRWDQVLTINPQRLRRMLKPLAGGKQRQQQADLPFYGYLGRSAQGGGLLVVVDGLIYPLAGPEDEFFRGIIWHDYLQRDLTLLNLVTDANLSQFTDQVAALYQSLK